MSTPQRLATKPRQVAPVPAPARVRAELLARYHQLSDEDKGVLRFVALMGVVTNRTTFLGRLSERRRDYPSEKAWTNAEVSAAFERLRKGGLMEPDLLTCDYRIRHDVACDAAGRADAKALDKAIRAGDSSFYAHQLRYTFHSRGEPRDEAMRALRLAVYTNDAALLEKLAAAYDVEAAIIEMLEDAVIDPAWLGTRPFLVQEAVFSSKIGRLYFDGVPDPDLDTILAHYRNSEDKAVVSLKSGVLRHDLESGCAAPSRSVTLPPNATAYLARGVAGTVSFLTGPTHEAIPHFRAALKDLKKLLRRQKNVFLTGTMGLFFAMALLRDDDARLPDELEAAIQIDPEPTGFAALKAIVSLVQGFDDRARNQLARLRACKPVAPMGCACLALAEYFVDRAIAERFERDTRARFEAMRDVMPMCARIDAAILAEIADDPAPYEAFLREAPGGDKVFRFTELIEVRDAWERGLDNVEKLLNPGRETAATSPADKAKRLAWIVDTDTREIQPMEQSIKGSGWTAGRTVSLKRLHNLDPQLDYLTEHDRRAIRAIRKETSRGYYREERYWLDWSAGLPALVGHPCVFDHTPSRRPLELVAYPAELIVAEAGKGYKISLSHKANSPTVFVEAETPSRLRVIEFPQHLVQLQEALGPNGLSVPKQGRQRVLDMVKTRSPTIPVRAEIAAADVPAVAGDPTPVVQLQPVEDGLAVTMMVRPFGADGPLYIAGSGGHSVLVNIDGQHQRANRDLARETAVRAAVMAASPTLSRLGSEAHQWHVEDLASSLELLLELRACPEPIRIEWPQGKAFSVAPPADASRMSLKLARGRQWFHVGGEVKVDDGDVVAMQELIDRLGSAPGRFVQLADGRFLALTRKFQQQLERLRAVSEGDASGRRLHPMGVAVVQDLIDDAGAVKADSHWKRFAETVRAAGVLQPVVPSTLQAELRDYQIEGFTWLSRLARWGAGACLADDMGLGKTVQAIAAMIDQAREGPCLVLAPTSVCHNWEAEIARFAPTLRTHRLGAPAERAALIGGLKAGDVLVTSYGLLHQESDKLAGVAWQMVVFDEAQALKNAGTKRAQASQKLDAKFRVALTGTPIENYLDELWSLFNTINPGLLGSHESFQKRFGTPIERDHNAAARNALRTLIRPFILRRTKSAVLAELPPRIELTHDIELPDDERAFYEALRRKALQSLENLSGTAPGQRKIHILAEIMRLRRACCHPGLIDPQTPLPGAKLEAFLELVGELIRNRHKALVFSQFVGNLERVRAALAERGIAYQYLDGSTPQRDRERAVSAFQAGEGEVFLISLRAGGVGLNLTAADYVIHLDPWWNPAVEDQASDRAHRIGQTRPVTIYRLIVRDSIEEQILGLHRDKRDLAADLLEGAETSARLSEEDLIGLIRG